MAFFFDGFIILMVCAKGFGFNSDDRPYQFFALVAIVFWIVYMMQVRWTRKTLLCAWAMLVVAFAGVVTNRKLGVMLSVMTIAAMKDIDRDNLMKMVQKYWLCSVGVKLMMVLVGIVPDQVISVGYKVYHTMGYATGNMLHATMAVLIMLYLYNRKGKVMLSEALLVLAANLAVYRYSSSRGGMLIVIVAVLTSYLFKILAQNEKLMGQIRRGLALGMVVVVFLSFLLPVVFNTEFIGSRLANVMNRMFTGRISNSHIALVYGSVTIFGIRGEPAAFLDNAYVYLLEKCGFLLTVMFFLIYAAAVRSMIKRKDDHGLLMVFWFVCYGFVEQLFVNSFFNYSMLIVGHEVMNMILDRKKSEIKNVMMFTKINDRGTESGDTGNIYMLQ